MQKSSIKRVMAILLVLIMAIGLFAPAYAAVIDFPNVPLTTISGALVADGNTRYYAEIEQNPDNKLITVTIKVANEGANQITIGGVCVGITYSEAVAPYRYISLTDPHPYVASRLYLDPGPPNTNPKPDSNKPGEPSFTDYCWFEDIFSAGSTAFCNNNSTNSQQGRFIGGKVTVVDESEMIRIDGGKDKEICKLFFMPVNGTDKLNLNMFKFEYKSTVQLIVLSPYIINGTRYLVHRSNVVSSTNTIAIYPQAFKMHILQPKPTGLAANQTGRFVENYIEDQMEWSYSAAGPYSSGTPVVLDEPHSIFVRTKGTDYSSDNAEFGNYKRAIPSLPVEVIFDKNFIPIGPGNAVVTKTSVNLTSTDEKNHVGDRIRYTIVAENKGHALSVWASAVMTDDLPDGVIFDGNVRLNNVLLASPGGYTFIGGRLTVPLGDIPGGTSKTVTFEVRIADDAYGKDITNSATVTGKDGDDDGEIIIDDDEDDDDDNVVVARSAAPDINTITEGDMTISGTGVNGATVVVTLPDGTVLSGVIVSGGVWTVTVPAGKNLVAGNTVKAVQREPGKELSPEASTVVVARPDPVKFAEKTALDITTTDEFRHVGDELIYTIIARNDGSEKSLWKNVEVTDILPLEVTFAGLSTVTIDGNPAGIAATYGTGTRTLTVSLGDIPGGVTKTVTFKVTINNNAYNNPTFKNTAAVNGITTEEPDPKEVKRPSRQPDVDEVNAGDRVITGQGIPNSDIEISFPNSTLKGTAKVDSEGNWSVPVPGGIILLEGDEINAVQTEPGYHPSDPKPVIVQAKKPVVPFMRKTSENTTSTDDKARPGDVILYTIEVGNSGSPKSFWTDGILTDFIPEGLILKTESVKVNGDDPTFSTYNSSTRKLEVSLWRRVLSPDPGIQGGTSLFVTFTCTIEANTHGMHIVNSASVLALENGDPKKEVNHDTEEEGGGFTVVGKSEQPDVDPITRGDTEITGEGVPGATIIVTLPDGKPPLITEVDDQGNWKVDVPEGREPNTGDIVVVVQTEPEKDASTPVNVPVSDKTYRAVHGYVYPMVDDGLTIGESFLRKHDIVIELRPTYQSASVASSTATLIEDTSKHPALAPFIATYGDGNLGEFTVENVPFGTYILVIKRAGYLVRCLEVTISSSTPDLFELVIPNTDPLDKGVFVLWWGDCNDDFRIDNADVMAIIELMEYGVNASSMYYNPACDMNADGRCDNADIMMVIECWNRYANQYAGAENIRFDI